MKLQGEMGGGEGGGCGGTKSASNREDVPALAWRQSEPADFSVGGRGMGAGLDLAGPGRVGGRTLLQINRRIFLKQTGFFFFF